MNPSWTPEQVEQLNRIQRGELDGHPHTCPNRSIAPHHDNGRDIGCLLATKDGWVCPDCGYTEGELPNFSQEPLQGATLLPGATPCRIHPLLATDIFALGV